MFPKWHVLIGFSASVLLVEFFHISLLSALVVFLASFLVDSDHYLSYAWIKKDLSLLRAIRWNFEYSDKRVRLAKKEKSKSKRHILIFHGIEFWIILFVIGTYWSPIFLFALLGIGIHMAADWIDFVVRKEPLLAKISQVLVWIRNGKW